MEYTSDHCREQMKGFYTGAQRLILSRRYAMAGLYQHNFNKWHSRYLVAIAPTPDLARDERQYCPECGQDYFVHTYLPATATEPPELQCPATDYVGRQGIETMPRQVLADHWERLGWEIDY